MESTQPTRRWVTQIVKDLNPILENYFEALLRMLPMQVRQVHKSSKHGPMVHKTDAYPFMGMFYIFLIRKEFSNLMGKEAKDSRSCNILKRLLDFYDLPRGTYNLPSDSESESENDEKEECHVDTEELLERCVPNGANNESKDDEKCLVDTEKEFKPLPGDAENESEDDENICPVDPEQVHKLAESYQKFRDPKNATIDILEDIFDVAKLHNIFFSHTLQSFHPDLLNMVNIETVLKHVASFDRSNILLDPVAGCEYFSGDAHFMLDDVLLQINTSVRRFQVTNPKCRMHMYQTLLYVLGFFVNEGKEIRKFKIYNPLLGLEYYYEVPDLDFNEFRKLVEELKPL